MAVSTLIDNKGSELFFTYPIVYRKIRESVDVAVQLQKECTASESNPIKSSCPHISRKMPTGNGGNQTTLTRVADSLRHQSYLVIVTD